MLVARSRLHTVREFPGPLSIKTVLEGKVAWRFQRRTAWVDSESFLILHDGEPYSMDIEEDRPVATCCVFFAKGYAETVARDGLWPHDRLLDSPDAEASSLNFATQFHPFAPPLITKMRRARQTLSSGLPPSSIEPAFLALADELLIEQRHARSRMANISSTRPGTRAETSPKGIARKGVSPLGRLRYGDSPRRGSRLRYVVLSFPSHLYSGLWPDSG